MARKTGIRCPDVVREVEVEVLDASDAEVRQRRAAGALIALGCRRGDRVAFALGSSADLLCAVLGAARVGLIPVLLNATLTVAERDVLADDAQPTVRIFDAASLAALTADDAEGAAAELAPYPLDPSDALHLRNHRPAQGRHDRRVGRGHGQARLRGRGGGLALRPGRPPHGLFADVPHGLDPLLDRHAALRGFPGHLATLRRRHRARHPAPTSARPRPSSSRRTCSASCSTRASGTTSGSTRCGCSRTRARRVPSPSSGRPWPGPTPGWSGSSTARPRPSSPSVRPTTGSSIPARSDAPAPDAASPSAPSTRSRATS